MISGSRLMSFPRYSSVETFLWSSCTILSDASSFNKICADNVNVTAHFLTFESVSKFGFVLNLVYVANNTVGFDFLLKIMLFKNVSVQKKCIQFFVSQK